MLDLAIETKRPTFKLDLHTSVATDCATAILGPNGSGKTTLLRSIAGLDPTKGKISLGTSCWLDSNDRSNLPVHKRPLGYVSQNPVLIPHLSVEHNIKLALWLQKRKGTSTRPLNFPDIVCAMGLERLLRRKPSQLSGGETSRVALAQALSGRPQLLLLDEPLSSIDIDRKAELIPYLRDILEIYAIPMLFVTHSLSEAVAICDRSMVLKNGNLHIHDATDVVLSKLDMSDVDNKTELGTVLHGTVVDYDPAYQLSRIKCNGALLVVPTVDPSPNGSDVNLRVRSRDVALATSKPQNTSVRNILEGDITDIETTRTQPFAHVFVHCGDDVLRAQLTRAAVDDLGLEKGTKVYALVKSATLEF